MPTEARMPREGSSERSQLGLVRLGIARQEDESVTGDATQKDLR